MPLATNPDATFEYVLQAERKLPKDKQPTFIFRYLSDREHIQLTRIMDQISPAESDAEAMLDRAYEVIKKVLVGWKNMVRPTGEKISFCLDNLEEQGLFTMSEAMELMFAAGAQGLTVEDKKKFVSPQASGIPTSAAAARDPQNAKKSRRRRNRLK